MWLQKQARSGRTKSLKKDLSLYPEVYGDSTGLQRVCDTRLKITHVIIQIAFGSSTVGTPPQGKRKKKKTPMRQAQRNDYASQRNSP